ncbi:MAG TPA: YkvA family protein [Candidatus Limnocylindria bacterium]|nr:YkvA family protein [Candidatus Limnocylindria bacterium]
MVGRLKRRARAIRRDTFALYLACRDPRTPWYVKLFAGGVVAYALSPIDLIPDVIPVVGYLDDLILVPFGIALAVKMIPDAVLSDCRARAQSASERPTDRRAAAVIVAIWIAAAALLIWLAYKAVG